MRNRTLTGAVVLGVLAIIAAGCAGRTALNSYVLEGAEVGGDPARSLNAIKSILVWPLENIAAGSKGKGAETVLTGVLADTLNLRGGFENVVIVDEDQAKDLLARAGEDLGLKKKPKSPSEGALITTKLGQLTGADVVLMGRLDYYDEDKIEKATLTVVASSFNLFDAREKAYASIDSFTPGKRVWRTNVKRVSKESPFSNREGLDAAARRMLEDVVDQLSVDLGQGAAASTRARERKVAELTAEARQSTGAGEFDKAVASWNEVLKIDPENRRAKAGIAEVERLRKEAEARAAAEALKKRVGELAAKAAAAEEAGDLPGAVGAWKQVLELDEGNKTAARSVEALEKKIAEEAGAQKRAVDEKPAGRRAAEKEPAAAPAPVPAAAPAPVPAPAAAAAPAPPPAPAPATAKEQPAAADKPAAAPALGAAGLEELRNEAMAAFNNEDYAGSRDAWKKILESAPEDKQAKEMLETTEMLLNALQ